MRRHLLPLTALVLALACNLTRADDQPEMLVFSGPTMGTGFTVKIVGLPESIDPEAVRADIDGTLQNVDSLMSTYRDDSELSRLNAHKGDDWFTVSPETASVLSAALEIGRLTDGAFDVTVGPVVNLWQFGPDSKPSDRVPSPDAIETAAKRTGLDKLEVRLDPPAVRKARPDVYVDLSGIAKGYAVDRVAECLARHAVENYFVDIGGELRVAGTNQRGMPWRIGIETPTPNQRGVQAAVPLAGGAMATSGDYRNYFESDGVRYCHLIDPRTARPITHRLASATVLDASCMRADALATALMVLGPEAAYELAVQEKLPLLLLVKTDTGFEEKATREFREATLADASAGTSQPGPSPDDRSGTVLGAFVASAIVFLLFIAALALGVLRGKRHECSCKQSARLMGELEARSCGGCDEKGELVTIQPLAKAPDKEMYDGPPSPSNGG